MEILAGEKPDEFRHFNPDVGVELDQAAHAFLGRHAANAEVSLALSQSRIGSLENSDKELLLAAEVMVERIFIHVGLLRDLVDPRSVVALVRKLLGCSVQYTRARRDRQVLGSGKSG